MFRNESDKINISVRLDIPLSSACPLRERIRKGLEELELVRPGGDTFMHLGIMRVSGPSSWHLLLQLQHSHRAVQSTR